MHISVHMGEVLFYSSPHVSLQAVYVYDVGLRDMIACIKYEEERYRSFLSSVETLCVGRIALFEALLSVKFPKKVTCAIGMLA